VRKTAIATIALLALCASAHAQWDAASRCDDGEESACIELQNQYERQRDAENAECEEQLERQREQAEQRLERHREFEERNRRLINGWGWN
jgi:hypothetical protein